MKRSLVVALLLSPLIASAQPTHSPKPNDFAYGMPLEVDGDGALYSFDLPTEVCRYSTRHDLGDLRIFNGYGEVVPYLLQPAVNPAAQDVAPIELPFFPIREVSGNTPGTTQINIATDEHGTVLDLWQRGKGGQEGVVGRYLIDASALQQPLRKLLLEWDETAEGFVIPLALETSNDLASWSPLELNASLASLSQGGYRLRQNEINLPPLMQAKYYRLSWPLGGKGIQLTSLRAVSASQGDDRPRRWQRYPARGGANVSGHYEYQVMGHFPFDRVRVVLPPGDIVARARLYTRTGLPKGDWQERFHGLLYHMLRDGQVLSSDVISLEPVDAPEWKLQVETDDTGPEQGAPSLELGWLPQRVLFVAQGEGPFTLAFASASVGLSLSDVSALLTTLQHSGQGEGFIKSAALGAMYELGGRYRLQAGAQAPLWRQWVLWAALTIGVLIVVMLARSLNRR